MKIQEPQFGEQRKKLMVFTPRRTYRCATKDRLAANAKPRRFKKKCLGIRVGYAEVVEKRPVPHTNSRVNESLCDNLRGRGNFKVRSLASDELQRPL